MASDQLYLDKWPLGRNLEILDIYWDLLTVLQVIKKVQITKQHQENDKRRRKNILEGGGDENMLSLIERTWWGDTSSVGFWEDLGQKGVKRILKVVIVSFLYFIPWVSGLCNNFNIVSRAGWKERTSWHLPPSSLPLESWNAKLLSVRVQS